MNEGHRCPTCDSLLPEYGGIVADDERGEVRFRGKRVSLTAAEFEVFRFLLNKAGRVASKEAILDYLYQLRVEVPEIKIIDVYVHKMRKKILQLGLVVGTSWGRGYYLEEPK